MVNTKNRVGKRFDHHFGMFVHEGSLMQRHAQAAAKEWRLAKTCAYRMAKELAWMQKHEQPKLLDMIQSEGKTVDQWLDAWFAPIASVTGEDYRKLFAAVAEGMSRAEYLRTAPVVFLSKKRALRESEDGDAHTAREYWPALPPTPQQKAPLEEQLRRWRDIATSVKAQLSEERRLRKLAEMRVAELEKLVDHMNKRLSKVRTRK